MSGNSRQDRTCRGFIRSSPQTQTEEIPREPAQREVICGGPALPVAGKGCLFTRWLHVCQGRVPGTRRGVQARQPMCFLILPAIRMSEPRFRSPGRSVSPAPQGVHKGPAGTGHSHGAGGTCVASVPLPTGAQTPCPAQGPTAMQRPGTPLKTHSRPRRSLRSPLWGSPWGPLLTPPHPQGPLRAGVSDSMDGERGDDCSTQPATRSAAGVHVMVSWQLCHAEGSPVPTLPPSGANKYSPHRSLSWQH